MKFDDLTARIVLKAIARVCRKNETGIQLLCETLVDFHPSNDYALFEYITHSALRVPDEVKNLEDDDAWRGAMRGFIKP